ncbi:HAD-like protein [Meredithblackwellia eburnea MCA 4105]
MSEPITIVFDVLGTLFSFDAVTHSLTQLLGDQHSAHLEALVDDWFHSSQRDFTYLSMNGAYKPIAQILKAALPRVILTAGFSCPESLDGVFAQLPKLAPRPSFAAASTLLVNSQTPGFKILAATNGGVDSTKGLLKAALGDQAGEWSVLSCDELQVAKPDPRVYEACWERVGLGSESGKERRGWFVASHTWDLFAAKKAGFKTAWVSYEEKIPCENIWGSLPDIIEADLEGAVKEIIKREQEGAAK